MISVKKREVKRRQCQTNHRNDHTLNLFTQEIFTKYLLCTRVQYQTHMGMIQMKKTPFLISRTLEILSVMLCSQTSESRGSLIHTEVAGYYPLFSDSVDIGSGWGANIFSQRVLMLLVLGPPFANHHYNGTFVSAKGNSKFRNFYL